MVGSTCLTRSAEYGVTKRLEVWVNWRWACSIAASFPELATGMGTKRLAGSTILVPRVSCRCTRGLRLSSIKERASCRWRGEESTPNDQILRVLEGVGNPPGPLGSGATPRWAPMVRSSRCNVRL
jgi:hypothetical protein